MLSWVQSLLIHHLSLNIAFRCINVNEGSKLEEIIGDVMHLVKGERVLDIGTGFGTVITKLLDNGTGRITSIDPEAWSFESIEREYGDEIATGVLELLRSGAESMPFENGTFDTSMAICSLHHVPDTIKGIREIERVTSGRVILTDWDPTSAGVHNPHSPDELQAVKLRVKHYANENGYNFVENGKWYLAWK